MDSSFSVLISVYIKEQASFLNECLLSLFKSTLLPNEIVIVYDGPVSDQLSRVVDNFDFGPVSLIKVVLEENVGLGVALNLGVNACSNNIVMRMDADDICRPERFELTMKEFRNDSTLALCGGFISEFESSVHEENRLIREVPISYKAVKSSIFRKNPFNHMTVAFRKSALLEVGNYVPMAGYEDYLLWIKLTTKYEAKNIPEILVDARAGKHMIARRVGWQLTIREYNFQRYLFKSGYISSFIFLRNILLRTVPRLLPAGIVGMFYRRFLRVKG